MKTHLLPLSDFKPQQIAKITCVATDIDDTLTNDGQLQAAAYQALWDLADAGISVVPVTGRPAGWCEMIARLWPVTAVVGENGAFYFSYDRANKKMNRFFYQKPDQRIMELQQEILTKVPGSAVASDQFCRLFDLAIDFCEDVLPLPATEVEKIRQIFLDHGAMAKISSIHVNGWYGSFNKLSTTLTYLEKELAITCPQAKHKVAFVGDSPNDEPMFEFFPNSFAVRNFEQFIAQTQHHPTYLTESRGGDGFAEVARLLLNK